MATTGDTPAVDRAQLHAPETGKRFGRVLLVLSCVLPLLVAAGGWLVYARQRAELKTTAEKSLAAAMELRAADVANWVKERRGDAEVARSSEVVRAVLMNPQSPDARAAAIAQIENFKQAYGYDAVILADPGGQVVLNASTGNFLKPGAVAEHIRLALHSPTVAASDLRRDSPDDSIHYWLSCPIAARIGGRGPLIGALLLVINPGRVLFPNVERSLAWSRSTRIFLLMDTGGATEGMNLTSRGEFAWPGPGATAGTIPASIRTRIARGREAVFETADDAGTRIIVAAHKIAGTAWTIVARTDEQEILSNLSRQAWNVTAIAALLLLVVFLAIGLLWRQQKLGFLRNELRARQFATESLRASERRFRTLVEAAPVAASISRNGRTIYGNRKFLQLYGYDRLEHVVGNSALERYSPEAREKIEERVRRRATGEVLSPEFESTAVRCDGTRFPVHVAVSVVELPDGPALLAFISDMTERHRATATLLLFRALVDHVNDAIEVIDPATARFLDVNERASQLLGFSREEFLELSVMDINPDSGAHGLDGWHDYATRIARLGSHVFESEHRRKDGSTFPVEINASYVTLDRDYIISVVRDITGRKRADQRFRQLNRVYAVLSGINELIVRERDLQRLFEAACRIAVETGEYRMAWVGVVDPATQRVKPAAAAGAVEGYLDSVEIDLRDAALSAGPTGRAFRLGEHQISNDIAGDPTTQPWAAAAGQRGYRSSAALPLIARGKVTGVFSLYASETGRFDADEMRLLDQLAGDIGVAWDLNHQEAERRRAEAELRDNEERFRVLIENASDIIAVINHPGVLRFVSPSAKRSLGYEPADVLGQSVFDFVNPVDLERVSAALQRLAADPGKSVYEEFRLRHRNGTWRVFQTVGRNLPDRAPDGFLVINARDVTETRQLEQQVRQAQKLEAIGQLAGGVAHDFNNILAVIMMHAQLSELEELTPAVRQSVQEIGVAAERAARLTRQLLMFSRKQAMQPRDLDLNEVVTGLARMLQRLIGADVQLQLQLSPAPLTVHADPGMLEQVLMNLVVNARDAMPRGGMLRVASAERTVDEKLAAGNPDAKPGRYACLSVTDTGSGIPADVLPRIFEPFFTTKEAGKGTGLGLATCFGIVRQHRGLITVESVPGQGATFHVFLPAGVAPGAESPRAAGKRKLRGGSETILVVEDDEMVRSVITAALTGHGYHVISFTTGLEAADFWARERPDGISLLLTDLVVPGGVSGFELSKRIRRDRPALKVIFMSGYSEELAGRNIELRPGDKFLQKPFPPDTLLETVRQTLEA